MSTKPTHIVVHPKQYLAVGGKLQHVPKGTEVALSAAKAAALEEKGRVMKIGQKEAVDLTDEPAKKAPAKKAPAKKAAADPVAEADAAAKAAGIDA